MVVGPNAALTCESAIVAEFCAITDAAPSPGRYLESPEYDAVIVRVPDACKDTLDVAEPFASSATSPESAVLPSKNCTVPPGVPFEPVTAAVRVMTLLPTTEDGDAETVTTGSRRGVTLCTYGAEVAPAKPAMGS